MKYKRRQATPLIDTSRDDFISRYRRAEHLGQIKDEERELNAKRYSAWTNRRMGWAPDDDDRLSPFKRAILIAILSVGMWALLLWMVLYFTVIV